jgi:DNA-binding response OmpR family regulator
MEAESAGLGGPGHRRKPSFIVVDDDADIREVLAIALTRYGVVVTTYGDARAALAGLQAAAADALVTDLALSPCDGLWLVKQVRALPALARLPIIVVTGHSDRARLDAARHAGVDDILLKPFDARDLYDRVARHLA